MKWVVAALMAAAILAAATCDEEGKAAEETRKEPLTDTNRKKDEEVKAAEETRKEPLTDTNRKKNAETVSDKRKETVAEVKKGKEEAAAGARTEAVEDKKPRKPPNIVILLADDLGIGDVGCYGNNTIKTPNIDSLARDGVRLTHHLAAAALCTPSRAALLTARYPARFGMVGDVNTPEVLVHVASRAGLPREEITLAEALSAANYTTAAVGKWHLGTGCGLFGQGCKGPLEHGFQHFFGLPFTLVGDAESDQPFFYFPLDGSDSFYLIMLTMAIGTVVTLCWLCGRRPLLLGFCFFLLVTILSSAWFLHTHYRFHTKKWWQVSPWMNKHLNEILMEDEMVIQQPLVLEGLSQRLASHSAGLIARYAREDRPFFLYHSFAHVHDPMFTVKQMAGKSAHGRYGDNVEEMDASVGEILAALHEHGLEENTIVYFLSDHGGHLEAVDPKDGQRIGGYNGLFKGGKGMGGAEGGIRVPGIFRWPGHIPAGVTMDTPTSLLDTLPTILELAGLPPLPELLPHLPPRELDGMSIADVLTKGSYAPSRILIHHCGRIIHALRFVYEDTVFKMHLAEHKWGPGSTQCGWGKVLCSCDDVEDYSNAPRLYDLHNDPYEDHPLSTNEPKYYQMVSIMLQFEAEWRERVPYPPSMWSKVSDTMLSLWLQPFRRPL